jgi:hypothetical protein
MVVTLKAVRLLLAAGVSALALGVAAGASGITTKSYCSTSGDVCYGISTGRAGNHRLSLTLAAKYFSQFRLCVRKTGQPATCKRFGVVKTGQTWGRTVIWERSFPLHGPGTYRVTWLHRGQRLGPALSFNLPAPAA